MNSDKKTESTAFKALVDSIAANHEPAIIELAATRAVSERLARKPRRQCKTRR